jgi:hypothetical protein
MSRQALPFSVRVGVQTLRANPMRTALSALGVVMGAASLVAVLSLGDGAESFARRQIEHRGLQTVTIQAPTSDTVDGLLVPRADVPLFTPDDVRDLARHVPPGTAVLLSVEGTGTFESRGRPRAALVTGLLASATPIPGLDIAAGRAFTDAELRDGAPVAVVAHTLAAELAGGQPVDRVLGSNVIVQDRALRVIGTQPQMPGERLLSITVPYPLAESAMVAQPAPRPRSLLLKAPRVEDVLAVEASAGRWADRRHRDWRIGRRITIATTGLDRLARKPPACAERYRHPDIGARRWPDSRRAAAHDGEGLGCSRVAGPISLDGELRAWPSREGLCPRGEMPRWTIRSFIRTTSQAAAGTPHLHHRGEPDLRLLVPAARRASATTSPTPSLGRVALNPRPPSCRLRTPLRLPVAERDCAPPVRDRRQRREYRAKEHERPEVVGDDPPERGSRTQRVEHLARMGGVQPHRLATGEFGLDHVFQEVGIDEGNRDDVVDHVNEPGGHPDDDSGQQGRQVSTAASKDPDDVPPGTARDADGEQEQANQGAPGGEVDA